MSHCTWLKRYARTICEQPPTNPSAFNRRISSDLETIILKALDKDRERRYQSADQLAGEIRRHLNGEPIEARPPTTWMRFGRWAARHPVTTTAVTCTAVAIISLTATLATVWWLNARPYRVSLYRSGNAVASLDRGPADEARLLTYGGKPMKDWGGNADAIGIAGMVDRPPELGGGKRVIIGYRSSAAGAYRGTLCAYEADGDDDLPVWSRRIETADILPELRRERGFHGAQFFIQDGRIADVFTDSAHPGDEVVAVFGHRRSQRVIRIYDLRGTLLYQVWHDGSVGQPYWMAQARLLVFVGDNAMVNWDRKGRLVKAERNPMIVFALRPTPGHISNDWLPLEPGDDRSTLVWYKCLYLDATPVARDEVAARSLSAPTDLNPGRFALLGLALTGEIGAGMGWAIDSSGTFVPGPPVLNDNYQIDQASPTPTLPDPNSFHLGDPPPTVSTARKGVGSSY